MKKYCIFFMCVLFLLAVVMLPISSYANDAITFESLWPTGTMNSVEGSGSVSYQKGVLTITKERGMTYAPIVSANIKTFLGEAAFTAPRSAKFTMHVEVKIPAYTTTTVIKAGMMIGAGVNGAGNLFQLTDAEQTGAPRMLRVQHHANIGAGAYATSALSSGVNFVADQWVSMDVLVDLTTEKATFYVDNNLVGAVDCQASNFGNAGWRVGFLGYKGVSFRNMQVMKGLVVPNMSSSPSPSASPSPSITPAPTSPSLPSATPSATEASSAEPSHTPDTTESPSAQPDTTVGVTEQSTVVPNATPAGSKNPNTSGADYSYMIIISGILLLASVVFAIYCYRKDRVRSNEE